MIVQLKEPDKMNLIGFFLLDLLSDNLKNGGCEETARRMTGAFLFEASGMQITLVFRNEGIEIHPGMTAKINAKITGEMNDLLDVVLGEGYLKLLLSGKIKIGGNILELLKLLKILRS